MITDAQRRRLARAANTVGRKLLAKIETIALDQARRAKNVADGDLLWMTSAGAGLAWGGAVRRWYKRS